MPLKTLLITLNSLRQIRLLAAVLVILLNTLSLVSTQASTTSNTTVQLLITSNLGLVAPQLSVNPIRVRANEALSFTTTPLVYTDNSVAANIVCRIIITAPDTTRVRLQGVTNAGGFCNYTTSQTLASQGLNLLDGVLANVNQKIGFSSAIVEYVFGALTPTTNTVMYEVYVDQIVLNLYKDRPNEDIYSNTKMIIQADIRNPNPFDVQRVETVITMDPQKLNLVGNSVRVGNTIKGGKYASFQDFFEVKAEAQAGTTGNFQSSVEYLEPGKFKVVFTTMLSAQTIPLTFEVLPLTNNEVSISGTSTITASGVAAQSNLNLSPQTNPLRPIFDIIRTGGANFTALASLLTLIILGIFFVFKDKLEEEVKIR